MDFFEQLNALEGQSEQNVDLGQMRHSIALLTDFVLGDSAKPWTDNFLHKDTEVKAWYKMDNLLKAVPALGNELRTLIDTYQQQTAGQRRGE